MVKSVYDEILEKRNVTFEKWENAYNLVKSEVKDLISSFNEIRKIPNPQFQTLTLNFYSIHLCNYFYFHVRKLLVDKNNGQEVSKLLTNGFSNVSSTPSPTVMNDILSYLIVDDKERIISLKDEYKKIYELRNKYAHGASSETNYSITFDEYKKIFDDISKI